MASPMARPAPRPALRRGGRLLRPGDVDVREHHVGALGRQVLGDLQAEALGRPGHQGDLARHPPRPRPAAAFTARR